MAPIRNYTRARGKFLAVVALSILLVMCGIAGAYGYPSMAGGVAGALTLIAYHMERSGGAA